MEHVDDLCMKLTVSQNSFQQERNLFLVDGGWSVGSVVKLTEDRIDDVSYERLQSRLRVQQVIHGSSVRVT